VPSLSPRPGPNPSSDAPAAEHQSLPAAPEGLENPERATLEANHVPASSLPPRPLLQVLPKVRLCLHITGNKLNDSLNLVTGQAVGDVSSGSPGR
ncbi:unnamed protein product, partial [Gulo gulo]